MPGAGVLHAGSEAGSALDGTRVLAKPHWPRSRHILTTWKLEDSCVRLFYVGRHLPRVQSHPAGRPKRQPTGQAKEPEHGATGTQLDAGKTRCTSTSMGGSTVGVGLMHRHLSHTAALSNPRSRLPPYHSSSSFVVGSRAPSMAWPATRDTRLF